MLCLPGCEVGVKYPDDADTDQDCEQRKALVRMVQPARQHLVLADHPDDFDLYPTKPVVDHRLEPYWLPIDRQRPCKTHGACSAVLAKSEDSR